MRPHLATRRYHELPNQNESPQTFESLSEGYFLRPEQGLIEAPSGEVRLPSTKQEAPRRQAEKRKHDGQNRPLQQGSVEWDGAVETNRASSADCAMPQGADSSTNSPRRSHCVRIDEEELVPLCLPRTGISRRRNLSVVDGNYLGTLFTRVLSSTVCRSIVDNDDFVLFVVGLPACFSSRIVPDR